MKTRLRTILTGLILYTVLFAVTGCASRVVTASSASTSESESAAAAAAAAAEESSLRDRSDRSDRLALMADLTPRDGRPVFLGVSGRLRNRDTEYDAAVLHVAEQASRYVRFFAEYRYITETTTGSVGYLDDITGRWDADFADSLIEEVEVIREVQDNEGTYVLGTVTGIPSAPAVPALPSTDGSDGAHPAWVDTPPRIPGHITVVGITTPSRRFRDSLDRADQEALKEILLNTGTTVRMIEDLRDRDRQGTSMTVTSSQEAAATLRSFYVLARYMSPDRRYYYSLAVAREE
jgi:hypothetical protein